MPLADATACSCMQVDVYDGTADFLRTLDLDEDALTKAIIGTIGDIDSYQLPDAKGYTAFMRHLLGVSDEERQQRREQILGTTLKDFRSALLSPRLLILCPVCSWLLQTQIPLSAVLRQTMQILRPVCMAWPRGLHQVSCATCLSGHLLRAESSQTT